MLSKKLTQFLNDLPEGPILRRIFSVLLRVGAGFLAFAGLFYIIDLLMSLAHAGNPADVLGVIFAVLITAAGTSLAIAVIIIRAEGIGEFSFIRDYSVTHLSAQLLRLTGEVLAIFHLAAGLSAGIMIWFGCQPRLPYFDSLMWRTLSFAAFPSFIAGLFAVLASILQSALTLLICYLGAELLLLFRDWAGKSRR